MFKPASFYSYGFLLSALFLDSQKHFQSIVNPLLKITETEGTLVMCKTVQFYSDTVGISACEGKIWALGFLNSEDYVIVTTPQL